MSAGVRVNEAAKHFEVDPCTVRRWIQQDCPIVRKGGRGPGQGALLNLASVEAWRGRSQGPIGLSADQALEKIAVALWESLDSDHADIRAGIEQDDAAAVLLVAFERCCKNFNVTFKFDAQPDPIRALMREL